MAGYQLAIPPVRIPVSAIVSPQEQKRVEKLLSAQFLTVLRRGITAIRASLEKGE